MQPCDAGLQTEAFCTGGKSPVPVAYAAQRSALRFLNKTYVHKHGLGLIEGPALSGKSTVAQTFMNTLHADVSRALVDGTNIDAAGLLSTVLEQFGYRLDLSSTNELINMLRVFAMQQTVAGDPPILAIENTHAMQAGALHVLCELADMTVNCESALRIVLMSDRSIENIIKAPEMACIEQRLTGAHLLGPMTGAETRAYLHQKLSAAGAGDPARVLPGLVCDHVFKESKGWPGRVERLAAAAITGAEYCPISSADVAEAAKAIEAEAAAATQSTAVPGESGADDNGHPRLYVTRDGKSLGEIDFSRPRLLVGRTEHNDLRIKSNFISRHHVMFVRHGPATLLMDLNSTNGTFVNSRRVSNYVMMHDDIISVGNHRIKFVHPTADHGVEMEASDIADTVIMKSLDDMRRLLKRKKIQKISTEAFDAVLSSDGR